MVTTEDLAIDNLLDEIHKTRDELHQSLNRAQAAEDDTAMIRDELNTRLGQIAEERHQLLMEARAQIESEMAQLQAEIRLLRRRLQAAGQPLEIIQEIESEAKELEKETILPVEAIEEVTAPDDNDYTFRLGDTVWVPSLNTDGEITEITEDEVEVQVGRLRVRAKLNEVERLNRSERRQKAREKQKASWRAPAKRPVNPEKVKERPPSPGLELDLRGSRVDDAMPQVESYLDAAYMAGLPFVRIIHGKGTGVLRKAIRDHLALNPLVAKHGSGSSQEGGDGVTVVHLVSHN
jgi:DNA mismatch repair protein MutS2